MSDMRILQNCLIDPGLSARHESAAGGANLAARASEDSGMTWHGLRNCTVAAAATLVVTVLLAGPVAAQDGYRIVVNPSNPVSSLSKSQVTKLFLEKSTWDDGAQASPVDLLPASPVREGFSKDVLGLSVPAAVDRMATAAAAVGANPPPAVASDREVLAYVRLKPGAIGYVSLAADVTGVKVIAVGGRTEHALSVVAPVAPLPVGGRIAMPERLVTTQPKYPSFARLGKIQGTVEVSVVIDPLGNVEKAQVVRSIPQLDSAAIDAVRKWKFSPTVVNGVAVPVTMVVHVKFAL
jgi:TonB family protein